MLLAPRLCTALIGCPRGLILGHRVLTFSAKYMFNYLHIGDTGCTSRCKINYFFIRLYVQNNCIRTNFIGHK